MQTCLHLGDVHEVRYSIFYQFLPHLYPLSHFVTHLGTPAKVRHTNLGPRTPPKARHNLELENPDDCSASICTSELCKEHSIKLQLYCLYCKELLKCNN